MKILLLTPPITQLNTPYPATAYLTGFLRKHGYSETTQRDPAIELIHRLFNKDALDDIKEIIIDNYASINTEDRPTAINHFLENFNEYQSKVDSVMRFLRGKDSSIAIRIASGNYLPKGPAFDALDNYTYIEGTSSGDGLHWAFGDLGVQDKAKYLSSLFLDDLASVIKNGVDPHFELSRYAERLAASNHSFDDLYDAIKENYTYIDEVIEELAEEYIEEINPDVVGISLPFPGNVYAGFKIAQKIKEINPEIKIFMGGGYPNTELRELKDARVFEFIDYMTLDDGERPILNLLENIKGIRPENELLRTYKIVDGELKYISSPKEHDIPHRDTGTPTYDGLDLTKYLSVFEMLNPMHRIWSDGRWNKLTLAHGCYWAKCSFCDISLDYIERYDETTADQIIDKMEQLIEETGQTGFHFVDEAAPPKIMFALAKRLIERNVQITWWGNIRFEKSFTKKRCELLARSGCIAVSGGLEVASDRLLKLMQKGVTVEQVAKVTKAFSDAGILVHAYLMYGFPSQTSQETIDSLERVRQLFENGCIKSAYWHRFAATVHSPVGKEPEKFGIKTLPLPEITFATNDIDFYDPLEVDHDMLGKGLRKALYNYMHGTGFDIPMAKWFDKKTPSISISTDLISGFLK